MILEIMGVNCSSQKAYNLRLDMLELMEYFIENDDLKSTLVYYGDIMLWAVLIPCMTWKAGMPNTKIWEGAIICTKKLIDRELISPETLYENFNLVFETMKNCIDDDYTSSIWYYATIMLATLLNSSGALL